jgi:hypothetical protein
VGSDSAGESILAVTTTGKPAASNDVCSDAIPLILDSGEVVTGTTVGASLDDVPNGICGEEVKSPGVWYSLVGSGSEVAVGLCVGTNFDTKISVFENTCENLTCLGGNDDFCDLQSAYGWPSQNGTMYYVLVHGFDADTVGDFGISAISN